MIEHDEIILCDSSDCSISILTISDMSDDEIFPLQSTKEGNKEKLI